MSDTTMHGGGLPGGTRRAGSFAPGVLLGLVTGVVMLQLFQMQLRYTLYGLLGVIGVSLLPTVVRRVGSLDRLLLMTVVLTLQLEVAWAAVFWGFRKVAGPYGILISPILIAAAALFLLRLWRYGLGIAIDGQLVRWSGLMLLAGVLSAAYAPDKSLVMFGLFELATVALIAFVICEQCTRPDGLRTVVQCLDWTLVLQSMLILVMFVTGVQLSLSHGVSGGDYAYAETGRFAGTLGTPSAVASLLVICILSLVCRIVDQAPGLRRLWMGCQIALGTFAVLITQTRSAWIALVLGGGGIAWSLSRRGKLGSRQLLQLLGLLLLAILLAWPFIAGRVAGSSGEDAQIRWNLVLSAIQMIKTHPFVGVGLNCATQVVFHYAALAGVAGSWVFIVHNQFLLLWAEAGLLAFVSFVALFKGALTRAWRALNGADPAQRTAGTWIFWSLIVLIQMLNLDHVSGASTYKLVFLVLGIAFGLGQQTAGAAAETPTAEARG